jgi:hypothetical protein
VSGLFFCKPWPSPEYTIIKSLIMWFQLKGGNVLFTFIVFVFLIGLCFFVYQYLTSQIISQRKRIMLLVNQNNELKNKLNKCMSAATSQKANNMDFIELSEAIEENFEET